MRREWVAIVGSELGGEERQSGEHCMGENWQEQEIDGGKNWAE